MPLRSRGPARSAGGEARPSAMRRAALFKKADWWGKPVLLTATIGGEEVRHWVTFYDPYA